MKLSDDIEAFLKDKSAISVELFRHFIIEYHKQGKMELKPAKTMIGVYNGKRRVAYINQFGKQFLQMFFMFDQPYEDNCCFLKIAHLPGNHQFNHHLRILSKEDVNEEVKKFMRMSLESSAGNDLL